MSDGPASDLPFPIDEYRSRWQLVHQAMAAAGLEVLVIWQKSGGTFDRAGDVFWLTNYGSMASGAEITMADISVGRSYAALLLRVGAEPELHLAEAVDATDDTQIAVTQLFGHVDLAVGLANRLSELSIEGNVGYVGDDFLPALLYRTLLALTPGISWLPQDDLLREAQLIKSPRELDVYREAGAIASSALEILMTSLIRGESESEAAAKAAAEVIRSGGGLQRVAVNHGPRSEQIMWSNATYGHRPAPAKAGDILRGWIYGPIRHGYWLDPGRTAVCGNKPTADQRQLIEESLAVTNGIIDAVRVGVTPRDIGRAGDDLIAKSAFASADASIWDIFGHGVGTFFQPPVLPANLGESEFLPDSMMVDMPIRASTVQTVETFLTVPGVGTATCEEVFIVHADGIEMLSTTPQLFW